MTGNGLPRCGAFLEAGRCRFTVWAPRPEGLVLEVRAPGPRRIPLERDEAGYWRAEADLEPGSRYVFDLAGIGPRPDPCSFLQPEGVHGPSALVDHAAFRWSDRQWRGRPLEEMVIYELHAGTFTPEGTFAAIVPRLAELRELGVNTLELMPVAQFPGERNWGYDGTHPFAVQVSYGGPDGLKALVDAAHRQEMAVLLDVVYNHLGPEGNYLRDFGPYFTDRYRTPWGEAINFDGPGSDPVRGYFIQNALYWLEVFHLDGLRLDAVHAIYDFGARHILAELADEMETLSRRERRRRLLIAESDLNDVRIIRPRELGGYGLDAQWGEDFHHALHTLLTGEDRSYYQDYGRIEHLEAAYRRNFYYGWKYSPFRRKHFGSPDPADREPAQVVVYSQNHDQIGNRLKGERLSALVPPAALRLAAGAVLLSPFVPMLFMGEEYGEEAPFLYFISHGDPGLVRATLEGRKREFSAFGWQEEPPDAQDPATFARSRLQWDLRGQGWHRRLLEFYRELLRLRREVPALHRPSRRSMEVFGEERRRVLACQRWSPDPREEGSRALIVMCFRKRPVRWETVVPGGGPGAVEGGWVKVLDSAEERWGGEGSRLAQRLHPGDRLTLVPLQFVLYLLHG